MNIIFSIFLYLGIIVLLHQVFLHFQSKYTKPIINHKNRSSLYVSSPTTPTTPNTDEIGMLDAGLDVDMDDDLAKLLDEEMA
jgi:hypothetical protein